MQGELRFVQSLLVLDHISLPKFRHLFVTIQKYMGIRTYEIFLNFHIKNSLKTVIFWFLNAP